MVKQFPGFICCNKQLYKNKLKSQPVNKMLNVKNIALNETFKLSLNASTDCLRHVVHKDINYLSTGDTKSSRQTLL